MKKSATKKKQEKKPRKVGRYLLMLVISIPLGVQLWKLDIKLPDIEMPNFELKKEVRFTNVIIDGDMLYASKEALQRSLSEQLETDFVSLDLEEIKAALLENSWYRNVSLSRVWPSTLKVVIEEEQPIARWGKSGFVNRYGEVIVTEVGNSLDHFPLLEGESTQAYQIAKRYLTISQLIKDQQLYITKLNVSGSGDWSLEINNDFELILGRKDISSRIERFLYLYESQLLELAGSFDGIDMRYENGVAVKWNKHALAKMKVSTDIVSR